LEVGHPAGLAISDTAAAIGNKNKSKMTEYTNNYIISRLNSNIPISIKWNCKFPTKIDCDGVCSINGFGGKYFYRTSEVINWNHGKLCLQAMHLKGNVGKFLIFFL